MKTVRPWLLLLSFGKGLKNLKKSPTCFDLFKFQNKLEIFSIFVAFSLYLNFNCPDGSVTADQVQYPSAY